MPIAPADRPYTMLPQLAVRANFPDQPFGLTYGMDFELANFQHNVDGLSTGWRADFAPEIRMPLQRRGRLHRAVGELALYELPAARSDPGHRRLRQYGQIRR